MLDVTHWYETTYVMPGGTMFHKSFCNQ